MVILLPSVPQVLRQADNRATSPVNRRPEQQLRTIIATLMNGPDHANSPAIRSRKLYLQLSVVG